MGRVDRYWSESDCSRYFSIAGTFFIGAGLILSQLLLGGSWYLIFLLAPLLLLGLGGILVSLGGRAPRVRGWSLFTFLFFLAYLLWRQDSSEDSYSAESHFLMLLGAAICYLSGAKLIWNRAKLDFLTTLLGIAILFQVLIAVFQTAGEAVFHPHSSWIVSLGLPRGDEGRGGLFVTGTFFSRSGLAGVLGAGGFLFLALSLWGRYSPGIKLLLLWTSGVSFCGLFLSGSRAGLVGAGVGFFVFIAISFYLAIQNRRGAPWVLFFAGGLATLVPALVFFTFASNSFSFSLILQKISNDPYREYLWTQMGPPLFKMAPMVGNGAGSFSSLALRYRTPDFWGNPVYPHNDWLQLALEYGLVGVVLGAGVLTTHLLGGLQTVRMIGRDALIRGLLPQSRALGYIVGSGVGVIAVVSHVFFDYSLNIPAVAWFFSILMGALSSKAPEQAPLESNGVQPFWDKTIGIGVTSALFALGTVAIWEFYSRHKSENAVFLADNCEQIGGVGFCGETAKTALALDPLHPRLNEVAGRMTLAEGVKETNVKKRMILIRRAAENYRIALIKRPREPELLRNYALSLSLSGDHQAAERMHVFAISRDPFNALGYQYLAAHYQSLGRAEESSRLLRIADQLPGRRAK